MHDDVEFHAEVRDSDETKVFPTWEQAFAYMDGKPGVIDVCIWSRKGAIAYGGSDAEKMYDMDPEASVFERWIRKDPSEPFDCQGMIP